MQTDSREIVSEVFCRVAEQIAFLFAEVVPPAEMEGLDQPLLLASMSFDGPLRGRLSMAVPRAACASIAANVLGVEPDDPSAAGEAVDAIKELLNVTCGHILTRLAGARPVFDLSIPQVCDLDEPELRALQASPDTAGFMVEENPLLLELELQEA